MKVAAVNFFITPIDTEATFFTHVSEVISEAVDQGAALVVLPEYTVAELYSIVGPYSEREAPRKLAPWAGPYISCLEELSRRHGVTIVGGTCFIEKDGHIWNACPTVSPLKATFLQYKNCLTTYEEETQHLKNGEELFIPPDALFGALICYDAEFPEAAALIARQGVKILCVPSSTETIHGFHRVRFACLSRAVEQQFFVVHSALVGGIGKEPHPTSYGSSAVIAPSASEFPSGPILAETPLNSQGIAVATLDLDVLDRIRARGEVKNFRDYTTKKWVLRNHSS